MMEVDLRKSLKNLLTRNSWEDNLINLVRPGCKDLKITGLALNVRPCGKRLPVYDWPLPGFKEVGQGTPSDAEPYCRKP